MPLFMSLALLLALSGVPTSVGPLIPRGDGAPSSVCSAFVVRSAEGPVMFTARHCLATPHPRAWLPGLEGNAFDTGKSRWTHLHSVASHQWALAPHGADVARASAPEGVKAFLEPGPLPQVGDSVRVWGYPSGVGPKVLDCRMAGMVVIDLPIPRVRPSLRCSPPVMASLKGMSGGPVLNAQGQVVGVVASGTPAPEGGVLLGFEPLSPQWLPEGGSSHGLITDAHAPSHRLEVRVRQGALESYRVLSPQGVAWSWWPSKTRNPVAPPATP